MSELKACPFCGCPAVTALYDCGWQAGCETNEVFMEGFATEADAIAAWNRRAPRKLVQPAADPKLLDAVEVLLGCTELNLDELEDNTREAIRFAERILLDIKEREIYL